MSREHVFPSEHISVRESYYGLTKRELFAAMIFQGMLSGNWLGGPTPNQAYKTGAEHAVEGADALIAALEGK